MANVNLGAWKEKDLPTNPRKEGAHYDSCPGCGREVEPYHVTGGFARGEEYYLHSLYADDRRKGGCGHNWSRTDRRAAAKDRARGIYPKHETGPGQTARAVFSPTDAFQRNYRKAFGHD